jgi:hypothetical protein
VPRIVLAQTTPEQAYVNTVIDALVRKGVLSEDDAQEIKTQAQDAAQIVQSGQAPPKLKWTDTLKVGGYGQARWQFYPNAAAGKKDNEFLVRRARTVFDFTPTKRAEVYLQTDVGQGKVEVRDAWAQYTVGANMASRFRMGQQKVPFGYETPQSSGSRLPLERNWLTRNEIPGERDTGLVYYWTQPADKELFDFAKKNEWAPGDYGTIAVGAFNGEGQNVDEVNSSKHLSIRYAKPFWLGKDRYAEAGASYYTGKYVSAAASKEFTDNMLGVHFFLAPHPLGLQAEYYNGKTEGDDLTGWYAVGMWRTHPQGTFFLRYDDYNGPKKGNGLKNGNPIPWNRHRTGIGYAYMLDDKTELTLEYDLEKLDAAPGGHNDQLGLQMQVSY